MGLGLEGVLDELLLDRRGALDGALMHDVLKKGAGDSADVDSAAALEAAVLDRDDRLADHRGDLGGGDDHAVLLADDAERASEVVEQDRALRVL